MRHREMFSRLPVLALLVAAGCGGSGDGGSDSSSDGGAAAQFVAYESNFDCFQNWSSAPAVAPAGAQDGLHVGPLRVYWNEAPPHGATAFPVGTIIVKESEDANPQVIFAMVKRGDGFNSDGANGWEWFSLQNNADCSVEILWRGVVAPAGETYANQPIGDCNGCHVKASSNDSVWDTALDLSNF